jgi:hypothetical protein
MAQDAFNIVWPHGHDQKPRLSNRAQQIGFGCHTELFLQGPEFVRIAIMHDHWGSIFRETQARKQRGRNAASPKKNHCPHESSAQTRSAAASSASTSLSVCTVEMIQCRPFEGVM